MFILQNVICLYRRYLYIVMTLSVTTEIIDNNNNNNYGLFLPHKDLVRLEKTTNRRREFEIRNGQIFKRFLKSVLNSES